MEWRADEGGIDALRAMGDKGRPPQLGERQLIERLFGASACLAHSWVARLQQP